jgi:tRNA 2-selenouridine synthase
LASHRGSAFGALGMPPQPRNEMFQNMLAHEWLYVDREKVLYLENESLTIGPILLPPKIYDAIRNSPVVELVMGTEQRIQRIVREYGKFETDILVEHTKKLGKRLGGQRTTQAIQALLDGDQTKWVEDMLAYYDKAYQYGNDTRTNPLQTVEVQPDDSSDEIAEKVIAAARDFNL